jgi:hypothetical protein
MQDHKEHLPMFITKLKHYPIVLRIPWLRLDNAAIPFILYIVTFCPYYCTTHCRNAPGTVPEGTADPSEQTYPVRQDIFELNI